MSAITRNVVRFIATLVLAISTLFVYLGFFVEMPTDRNRARLLVSFIRLREITKAVEQYRVDCGDYPSSSVGLSALVVDPGTAGWHGPYMKDVPLDGWRRPYVYIYTVGALMPETLSYGADGKLGGTWFDADITSRNPLPSVPESPFEVRWRRVYIAIWIGAWCGLIGSILVLVKTG